VALPPELRAAVERELERVDRSRVARAAQQISADYKGARFCGTLAAPESRAAYLITRLPATFAASLFVFREIQRLVPDLQPASFLDLGAGPGTASWAAAALWPSLSEFKLFESNREMIELGKRLASESRLNFATWIADDLQSAEFSPADVVVLSYAIGELRDASALVQRAWTAAKQLLVIIEPGTPKNFQQVAQIRRGLITSGAQVVAPCPHHNECPMWAAGDWCHFAVRLERTSEHRRIKGGALGYEDEKFSYVAFSKQPLHKAENRIVRHPMTHSGYIRLTLCTPDGLKEQTVTRSQKDAFRAARRAKWGDEWNQFE
jgi:ribosomal protein RSM22 (predicted rRNA methylase)